MVERGPERPQLCSSLQVDSFTEKLDLTRVDETRAADFRVALVMASVTFGLGLTHLRPELWPPSLTPELL